MDYELNTRNEDVPAMRKGLAIMLLCLAGICLQSGAVEDAAKIEDEGCLFEQKTRQALESAKSKDWWGYYDFPRLSLKVFAHSAPNLKKYFETHPDRLFALQLDALKVADGLRDKSYSVAKAPKEHRALLFNGNAHAALLKKQKTSKDTLTAIETGQLKFAREFELEKVYRAYLEQCQNSLKEASGNVNLLTRLLHILSERVQDEKLKAELLPKELQSQGYIHPTNQTGMTNATLP